MGIVIAAIIAFLAGGTLSYAFFKYGLKTKYDKIIKEAETEAEVIKKEQTFRSKREVLE